MTEAMTDEERWNNVPPPGCEHPEPAEPEPQDWNDVLRAGGALTTEGGEPVGLPPEPADPSKPPAELPPTWAELYGAADLEADKRRELVSLARLPGWYGAPGPGPGHGWGPKLDKLIGGGLEPGELVGVGASTAGAGKTAFIHQLADGLALRSALVARGVGGWGKTLTPVLWLSEMNGRTLVRRSLARWLGVAHTTFREYSPDPERGNAATWDRGAEALRTGDLAEARRWVRPLDMSNAGELDELVGILRRRVEAECPGFPVVPCVFVDPVQRGADMSKSEIEGMNEWSDRLRRMTSEQLALTFVTSDTNKESARGQTEKGKKATPWDLVEEGVAAFRGTYRLQHDFDVALYLKVEREAGTMDAGGRYYRNATVAVVKTRNGLVAPPWPEFRWYGGLMRFEPTPTGTEVA